VEVVGSVQYYIMTLPLAGTKPDIMLKMTEGLDTTLIYGV
jgi:hypothetical protein